MSPGVEGNRAYMSDGSGCSCGASEPEHPVWSKARALLRRLRMEDYEKLEREQEAWAKASPHIQRVDRWKRGLPADDLDGPEDLREMEEPEQDDGDPYEDWEPFDLTRS